MSFVHVKLRDGRSAPKGYTASGLITTNLPGTAVFMTPRAYMSVGGTSSVIGVALMGIYIETDY